jgi:hypothetical protein
MVCRTAAASTQSDRQRGHQARQQVDRIDAGADWLDTTHGLGCIYLLSCVALAMAACSVLASHSINTIETTTCLQPVIDRQFEDHSVAASNRKSSQSTDGSGSGVGRREAQPAGCCTDVQQSNSHSWHRNQAQTTQRKIPRPPCKQMSRTKFSTPCS